RTQRASRDGRLPRVRGGGGGGGLPEAVAVVVGDGGDHGDAEVEHVGAVEPAAQPHLADDDVGLPLGGGEDAERGEDLELGGSLHVRLHRLDRGTQPFDQAGEVVG